MFRLARVGLAVRQVAWGARGRVRDMSDVTARLEACLSRMALRYNNIASQLATTTTVCEWI